MYMYMLYIYVYLYSTLWYAKNIKDKSIPPPTPLPPHTSTLRDANRAKNIKNKPKGLKASYTSSVRPHALVA
jgi:hypothetical protein